MPTIHEIQGAVCAHFGVTRFDLLSERRGKAIARPRQVAMWLARYATPHSIPTIGRAFGRDHTTVMHGIQVIDKLVKAGDETGKAAVLLLNNVNNGNRSPLRLVA